MKKENIALGIFLAFIVGAGIHFYSLQTAPQNVEGTNLPTVIDIVTPTKIKERVLPPEGVFSSTYIPHEWTMMDLGTDVNMMLTSPDYLLENPAVIKDCKGTAPDGGTSEGCATGAIQQVLGKGAYFQLAYIPCLYKETETEFRQREQRNSAYLKGLVEQNPIIIEGHQAVLFHTRFLSNTAHPATENIYHLTLISSVKKPYCQNVNFGFIESATIDYGAEFQKFINGLRFIPNKSSQ